MVVEQGNPISRIFNFKWLQEGRRRGRVRSPQGSGSAPAYSNRLPRLENDMAEIRDCMRKEVLKKLRLLSDERSKKSTEASIHLIVQATPSKT